MTPQSTMPTQAIFVRVNIKADPMGHEFMHIHIVSSKRDHLSFGSVKTRVKRSANYDELTDVDTSVRAFLVHTARRQVGDRWLPAGDWTMVASTRIPSGYMLAYRQSLTLSEIEKDGG